MLNSVSKTKPKPNFLFASFGNNLNFLVHFSPSIIMKSYSVYRIIICYYSASDTCPLKYSDIICCYFAEQVPNFGDY